MYSNQVQQSVFARLYPFFMLGMLLFSPTELSSQEDTTLWTSRWSPDGKWMAVGGSHGKLHFFESSSFKVVKTLTIGGTVSRLDWHPTEPLLAIVGTENCQILNVESWQSTMLKGVPDLAGRSIAWNHNGEKLVIADYEGKISFWTKEGELIRTITKDNTYSYVAVDWHPFKDEIIALGKLVRIYDIEGNLIKSFQHRPELVLMLCVQWHPSGDFFVIGDYGDYQYHYPAVLQFWNADYTLRQQIFYSKAEYRNIRWNQDASQLAAASDALRIWSLEGKLLHEGASPDYLWGLDWHPEDQQIITSSGGHHIRIWDPKAKMLRELSLN